MFRHALPEAPTPGRPARVAALIGARGGLLLADLAGSGDAPLAAGDALGNTTETESPSARQAAHGELRDYLEGKGYPSDDSQLAFWTLEQLLEDVPEHVARRFSRERIFGIGRTVRGFLRALKSGLPWQQCGQHSAANGCALRPPNSGPMPRYAR